MATGRADKIEVERRVNIVYRWILDGWSAAAIVETSREKWDIRPAMAYRYIGSAWERIAAETALTRSEHHAIAVSAGYAMLRECEDIPERLKVWGHLAKLLALYPAKPMEVEPPVTTIRLVWADEDADAAPPTPPTPRAPPTPPAPEVDYSAIPDEELEQLADGRPAVALLTPAPVEAERERALIERVRRAAEADERAADADTPAPPTVPRAYAPPDTKKGA